MPPLPSMAGVEAEVTAVVGAAAKLRVRASLLGRNWPPPEQCAEPARSRPVLPAGRSRQPRARAVARLKRPHDQRQPAPSGPPRTGLPLERRAIPAMAARASTVRSATRGSSAPRRAPPRRAPRPAATSATRAAEQAPAPDVAARPPRRRTGAAPHRLRPSARPAGAAARRAASRQGRVRRPSAGSPSRGIGLPGKPAAWRGE